jgi:hypothetical protein
MWWTVGFFVVLGFDVTVALLTKAENPYFAGKRSMERFLRLDSSDQQGRLGWRPLS